MTLTPPRIPSHALAWSILVLLAAGAPAQAGTVPLIFHVSEVQSQGISVFTGELAAIRLKGSLHPQTPSLAIRAPMLHVETDFKQVNVSTTVADMPERIEQPLPGNLPGVNQSVPPTPLSTWSGTTSVDLPHGALSGLGNPQPLYDLFLAPLDGQPRPTLTIQSKAIDIGPSNQQSVQQPDHFMHPATRRLVSSNVSAGLDLLDQAGPRSMTVTGSFVAIFWSWNLTADGSTNQFPSGEVRQEANPPLDAGEIRLRGVGKSTDRQTYVYVRDGQLSLQVEDATWYDLYAYAGSLHVDGRVVLKASTPIGSDPPVTEDREFKGVIHAALESPASDGFTTRFLEGSRFSDQGGPLGIPPVQPENLTAPVDTPQNTLVLPAQGHALWPFPLALVLVLGVSPAAAVLAKRRRMARLRALMERQEYEKASLSALRLLVSRLPGTARQARETAMIATISILKLGQGKQAEDLLATLAPRQTPDPPTLSYLRACARVLQGDGEAAARNLAECIRQEPRYAEETLHNPWFHELQHHPLLKGLLQARPGSDPEGYA
jgi:hypothetical protein